MDVRNPRRAKNARKTRTKTESPSKSWWWKRAKHIWMSTPLRTKRRLSSASFSPTVEGPLTPTRVRLIAIFVFGLFFIYELFLIPALPPPSTGIRHGGVRTLSELTDGESEDHSSLSWSHLWGSEPARSFGRQIKALAEEADAEDHANEGQHAKSSHKHSNGSLAESDSSTSETEVNSTKSTIDDKVSSGKDDNLALVEHDSTDSTAHRPLHKSSFMHEELKLDDDTSSKHEHVGANVNADHHKVSEADLEADEKKKEERGWTLKRMRKPASIEGGKKEAPPATDTLPEVDRGSSTTFMDWFQNSEKEDKEGDLKKIECPKGHEKTLCESVFKVIRKHKIRVMVDISCHKNRDWMPVIISKVQSEIWGFKYYCSNVDAGDEKECKDTYKDSRNVEYLDLEWWRDAFPEATDLVFAWDTLRHSAYGRIWTFLQGIRKNEVPLVMFDNFPSVSNEPSPTRTHVNVRRHPFKLPPGKEVFQKIGQEDEDIPRQLAVYESDQIPAGRQK